MMTIISLVISSGIVVGSLLVPETYDFDCPSSVRSGTGGQPMISVGKVLAITGGGAFLTEWAVISLLLVAVTFVIMFRATYIGWENGHCVTEPGALH